MYIYIHRVTPPHPPQVIADGVVANPLFLHVKRNWSHTNTRPEQHHKRPHEEPPPSLAFR